MKLAIIGSRNFADKELLFSTVDKIRDKIELIISGGAVGADSLAQEYAKERGLPILVVYPNWRPDGKFDKGAGFRRNIDIVKQSSHVLAFWDKKSHGTEHSISVAEREGKPVKIIEFQDDLAGYYIVSGSEHPLSLEEETPFSIGEKKWMSVKHALMYYIFKISNNDSCETILSLDISKKRDLKILNTAYEDLDIATIGKDNIRKVLLSILAAKFSTTSLKEFLASTEGEILYCEKDTLMGVGFKRDHPNFSNKALWGDNLLGKSLEKIRNVVKETISVQN